MIMNSSKCSKILHINDTTRIKKAYRRATMRLNDAAGDVLPTIRIMKALSSLLRTFTKNTKFMGSANITNAEC